MIAALAFLPLQDVHAGFDELSEILPSPECDDIYRYFKENYIGPENPNPRRRRENAKFPPGIWNQHDRTTNDKPRTNNV